MDKLVLVKDGYLVTIRRNVRDDGKKIADKNWILTAYKKDVPATTKAPADGIYRSTAVAPDTSSDANLAIISDISDSSSENVEDENLYREVIDDADKEKTSDIIDKVLEVEDELPGGRLSVNYDLTPEKALKEYDKARDVRFSLREGAMDEDLYREDYLEQVNQRFNEELKRQIDGSLPEGHIYQLGTPSDILLSTGVPNLPIQMSASKLKEKATSYGHDFDLSAIRDIVKSIQSPIAVFAYGNKNKAQNLIIEIRSNGKNFVVGLSLNPVVGGKVLEINSVRNVFPKDTAEWLNWITQEKALYIDKERIQDLIDQQRTILADVDYLDLDSVTKIVKDSKNPNIEDENLYREVTDDNTLEWLDKQPKVTAYRAMQVIDGRLYSPMASGKKKDLGAGYGLNAWDVATEMAFNVTDEMMAEVEKLNNSDKNGYVEVVPGKLRFVKDSKGGKASLRYHLVTDETDVWAAYNPYNHNSDSMLNDQFKAAYRRGNLVVVKAEVPVGDLESGYRAPYSKDAVGETKWKSGDVASQFPEEMQRTVYLSRYTKPVEILSNKEVAKWIGDRLRKAEELTGKPITLYEASFHPEVKRLLEADGFTFVPVKQPKGKVGKVLEGHPDYT